MITLPELWKRPIVRQFAKFCIVGGISFVIDLSVRLFLLRLKLGGQVIAEGGGAWILDHVPGAKTTFTEPIKAFFPVAAFCGAAVATLNSFVLNRRFTFGIRGEQDRAQQMARVYLVSFTGMALNTIMSSAFNNIIPGHPARSAAIATLIAAVIVALFNFTGQRTFAFKVHKRRSVADDRPA